MKTLQQGLLLSVFAVLLFPLTACALSSKALEGQVLEESTKGTKKPIPDAIVVAHWIGTAFSFVESSTVCVHVMVTTTDAEGKYHFPSWHKESPIKGVRNVHAVVIAYKPGYQLAQRYPVNNPFLQSFKGTREDKLKYLLQVLGTTSCGAQDQSEKNLILLRKMLYDEALKIAQTEEDQKTVEAILYRLEILELGFEEAGKRHLERAQRN